VNKLAAAALGVGAAALVVSALLVGAPAFSAPSIPAYAGYPNSIAVLGHSGATGENSGVMSSRGGAISTVPSDYGGPITHPRESPE
jgi:hypothetical protein